MYRFSKKLKVLKQKIKVMSKNKLGDLTKKKANEAFLIMCQCQVETFNNPYAHVMRKKSTAYDRWLHVSLLEEIYEEIIKTPLVKGGRRK